MAEGKKSFILYADYIDTFEHLTNEQRGEVIWWIFQYVNDKHPEPLNGLLMAVIAQIRAQLKRDLDKYRIKLEQSSESGRIGNLKRWNTDLYNDYLKGVHTLEEAEAIAKDRKVSPPDNTPSPPIAKIADTVNDNGTDTDTVNGTDTVNDKKEVDSILLRSITDVNELDDQVDKITFSFWQLFKRNLEEAGITKTTNLDKATLEKWRVPVRLAIESDKRTREEFEEIWKFLGKNEFWKKNIQSTVKLREQFERLLVEARTKPQAKEDKNKMSDEYMARLAEKLRS
jgi:hypothetical protein